MVWTWEMNLQKWKLISSKWYWIKMQIQCRIKMQIQCRTLTYSPFILLVHHLYIGLECFHWQKADETKSSLLSEFLEGEQNVNLLCLNYDQKLHTFSDVIEILIPIISVSTLFVFRNFLNTAVAASSFFFSMRKRGDFGRKNIPTPCTTAGIADNTNIQRLQTMQYTCTYKQVEHKGPRLHAWLFVKCLYWKVSLISHLSIFQDTTW